MAADNIAVTPGTGAIIAAEAISGTANALVQRVKIVLGDVDSDGGDVSSDNQMPISGTITAVSGTAGNFLAAVSGTVTVTGTTTVVSGTAANLLSQVSGTVTAVSGTAGNLLASVSGTVTATGTVTVISGTAGNLLSQVSGTVTAVSGTAANLLAQVSGTVTATGTVGISGVVVVSSGTAANFLTTATVSCGTAANLNATVVAAAGTALIGVTISPTQINSVYNGTAAVTPQFAVINFTASAGNTIVAAVASKNIYILSGVLICQGATNLQWFSGTTAGTAVSGVMCMTANMGFQIPYVPIGNMVTQATNSAITLSSSVAVTVGGWVTYVAF